MPSINFLFTSNMKLVRIQGSFLDVINDMEAGSVDTENVWAEIIGGNPESGKFRVHKDEIESLSPGLVLRKLDHWRYLLSDEESTLECLFPVERYDVSSNNLTSVDVTSNCGFVVGDSNGRLLYGKLGSNRSELKVVLAHEGGVVKVRYFPSGKVMISAGLDMMLKIWDCETGDNPRTFSGHQASITNFSLIGRGRNFVTSSLDGKLKLWECSTGLNVATMDCSCGVTTVKVLEDSSFPNLNGEANLDTLFEAEGKIAICGLETGNLKFWRIADQILIKHLDTGIESAVASMAIAEGAVYVGYTNGKLVQVDLATYKISMIIDVAEKIVNVKVLGAYIVISFGLGNLVGYSIKDSDSPIYFAASQNDVPMSDVCIQDKSVYAVGKYGLFEEFLL